MPALTLQLQTKITGLKIAGPLVHALVQRAIMHGLPTMNIVVLLQDNINSRVLTRAKVGGTEDP